MPASVSPSARKAFDYNNLDAETSQLVQQNTGEIRSLMKHTAQGIIKIGQKLIEVKEKLGHGRFGAWLKAEFDWSWDTANRFMNVAQRLGQIPPWAEFEAKALYLLAARSTPENARKEAISRAEAGEPITHTAAKTIKQKYTTPATKLKPEPLSQSEPLSQTQPQPTLILALPPESRSKLGIVAIRPSKRAKALKEATKAIQVPQAAQTPLVPQPSQIVSQSDVPGIWWRLAGRHLLYCGEPQSAIFQQVLPNQVALSLTFPPSRSDWPDSLAPQIKSAVCLFTPYQDQDWALLRELVERALLLYSESDDAVIFSFLPEPELLLLAHKLDCRCFVAEPDAGKCEATIATLKKMGAKVEHISG